MHLLQFVSLSKLFIVKTFEMLASIRSDWSLDLLTATLVVEVDKLIGSLVDMLSDKLEEATTLKNGNGR